LSPGSWTTPALRLEPGRSAGIRLAALALLAVLFVLCLLLASPWVAVATCTGVALPLYRQISNLNRRWSGRRVSALVYSGDWFLQLEDGGRVAVEAVGRPLMTEYLLGAVYRPIGSDGPGYRLFLARDATDAETWRRLCLALAAGRT